MCHSIAALAAGLRHSGTAGVVGGRAAVARVGLGGSSGGGGPAMVLALPAALLYAPTHNDGSGGAEPSTPVAAATAADVS